MARTDAEQEMLRLIREETLIRNDAADQYEAGNPKKAKQVEKQLERIEKQKSQLRGK